MKDYCFNYKYLIGIEWKQVCTAFQAADDEEAIRIAKVVTRGRATKDLFLIPYERLVRI